MKYLPIYLVIWLGVSVHLAVAEDFRQDSKLSQVVGDVVDQPMGGASHPAQIDETFAQGDILKTGAESRAELTAPDTTVIRVGANSVFSFSDQTRQMILQQGSMLFHTPHGQGGGIIKTSAVTASVTGSTVAVSTTSDGGAKVVPLESLCVVTAADGRQIARITPGQLLALFPGSKPAVYAIDLGVFVHSSGLIKNFSQPLSPQVQSKIDQNISKQASNIQEKTNIFLVDNRTITSSSPVPDPNSVIGRYADLTDFLEMQSEILFGREFVQNLRTDLVVDANFPTELSAFIHRLSIENFSRSPLAYIEYTGSLTPSPIFTSSSLSAETLATLGITAAYPSTFVLPGPSEALIGLNVRYNGGSSTSFANLASVQNDRFFAVVALGTMVLADHSVSSEYFQFANEPQYVSFGARGTLTVDGSALSLSNPLTVNVPDSTLSFGAVGTLTMNNVLLEAGNNIYLGSRTMVNFNNVQLMNTGSGADNMAITSRGEVNLNNLNINAGGSCNLNILAGGQLNINQAILVNANAIMMSATTLNLQNVHFGSASSIILQSQLGAANFNGVIIAGDVNFLGNVTARSTLLTSNNYTNYVQVSAR